MFSNYCENIYSKTRIAELQKIRGSGFVLFRLFAFYEEHVIAFYVCVKQLHYILEAAIGLPPLFTFTVM